jgi:hypothetical protein
MPDSIRESKHEREVRFHEEAPFSKHDSRYRSKSVIRMAGEIWGESQKERSKNLKRERMFLRMRETPVGLGFANRDSFGPDDTYESIDYLSYTPAQEY